VRSILTVIDTTGLIPDNETDNRERLRRVLEFISKLDHDESLSHKVQSDDVARLEARAIGKPKSRGELKNGELLKTAEHKFDVTRELLEHGVLLPEHVPIVCPSFAASDLATLRDERSKPVDYHGCDELAGHDAWSICDYLRDALLWPTESVFIDKEAFGTYYRAQLYATLTTRCPSTIGLFACVNPPPQLYLHPRADRERNDPRGYRQVNVHAVDEVLDKDPLVIKRNYRKVYQWAQRVSPVAILFLSKKWVNSPNCTDELDDLITL
jgi:hypothetical protein